MPDILVKAHVQHLIGLIEDDLRHMAQVNVVVLVMVHEAARGRHDDLAALCQALCLFFHVSAAVDAGHFHFRHKIGQRGELLCDLLGQLPGRGHNDGLRCLEGGINMLCHRDAKGAGLARARGRFGDDIAACQHDRDGLFLDLGHLRKAHPLHGLVDGLTAL